MIRPPGINYSTPITMEVLESTFHEHYEGLHRYAYSLTGDNETAKDVVQQVFTTLWEKRDQLTITNSLRAYLYRAVHNACHNLTTRTIRHQPVEKLKEEDLGYPGVQPEFLREIRELEAIIRATIDSLPPRCRTIFIKSREEEKTYPVIAREMGLSVKTIEAQMSKALKVIRRTLQNHFHQS